VSVLRHNARVKRDVHGEVWRQLGRNDPDWAVLTVPARRHGGWAGDLEDFYRSGEDDVEAALRLAGVSAGRRALDWGAGTGRLSRALAARFDEVTAVDISPGMLDTLRQRLADEEVGNVTTQLVEDFDGVGRYDFALSLLVLQHLADVDQVRNALTRMLTALRPTGAAVVELPARALTRRARLQPRFRVYRMLRRLGLPAGRLHRWGLSGISMLVVSPEQMRRWTAALGGAVVANEPRPDHDYLYVRYVLRPGPVTGGEATRW
jgi:2-polyprenyl-3-methyl-5-hydroxy-6-metoxy-1,4-benzoquinol methylase